MDPLGAPSQFVDVYMLPSWGDSCEDELSSDATPEAFQEDSLRSPFLYNKDINGKLVLWKGDVALLNCTAIVNTSNESLTDKNPVSESIFMLAGPDLKEDLQKLKGCRTGEAKLTKGFNLAARFIIHTVGPKYKSRYRTAAESSLYSCYRNVLQLAKEQSMSSVGFCVINSAKRGYPLEDATHIALRTVRRFLEIHGETIEKVVFAVSELEEATYQKLLPLYFPRSLKEESQSLPSLPADIGNAEGEPVVPERQIRISEKPGASEDNHEEEDEGLGVDVSFIGSHAFARMEGDIDKQRKLVLQGQLSEAALQKQHQRKYKRNLKAVYFVHPTFRSKVSTWFFTTFSVSGLKDKVHHVDSLHQLFSAISPEQIDFPPFVLEYDARENGPYYTSYPPSPDL
uniref:ganglioside-induced differentiation-associated protein 2 isoform X3 n=1 Tax=Jaculus jaculus TaxID=51337 RepID=UPI001E1B55BB|nr:ganglioside-induced differentiation-associated protein 2 isoform X3 [Jaculus jaculus]